MARLLINPDTAHAWEIHLKPGTHRLGRAEGNDFLIPHPSVSSSHCQIVVDDAGVVIRDLGSSNGTFVDRAPVSESRLRSGQRVQLGAVDMVFEDLHPGPAASPPPVPVRVVATGAPRIAVSRPTPVLSEPGASAPAPIIEPRTAPSIPVPVSPSGGVVVTSAVFCKFHPKSPGRFLCQKCNRYYCDACVGTRSESAGKGKFCRTCGSAAVPVQARLKAVKAKSFYAQIPGAFGYPVRGMGLLILLVVTILVTGLNFVFPMSPMGLGVLSARMAGWGLMSRLFVTGYLFAYLQSIIHSTAADDDQMPDPPGMGDFIGDVLAPAAKMLGLVFVCFGPAYAIIWYAGQYEQPGLAILALPAALLGAIYFPMAFLAVAMKDSVMAANPLVVIPSMIKVPGAYFVSIILLGIVFAIRSLGEIVMALCGLGSMLTKSMSLLLLMLGLKAFLAFLGLYLLSVGFRVLGLLYRSYKDELGWF